MLRELFIVSTLSAVVLAGCNETTPAVVDLSNCVMTSVEVLPEPTYPETPDGLTGDWELSIGSAGAVGMMTIGQASWSGGWNEAVWDGPVGECPAEAASAPRREVSVPVSVGSLSWSSLSVVINEQGDAVWSTGVGSDGYRLGTLPLVEQAILLDPSHYSLGADRILETLSIQFGGPLGQNLAGVSGTASLSGSGGRDMVEWEASLVRMVP